MASWLSEIAQKNGICAEKPLRVEVPKSGGRKPVWRSRRIAAAKNGTNGMRGTSLSQNETFVP